MEQQEIFLQSLPCVPTHELPLAHGEGAENISMQTFLKKKKKLSGHMVGTRGEAVMEPFQGKQPSILGHGVNTDVLNCKSLEEAEQSHRVVCRRGFAWRAGLPGCWPQCEAAQLDLEIGSGDGMVALRGTGQLCRPLSCPGAGPRLAFILSCSLRAPCLHLCLPAQRIAWVSGLDFW